MIVQETSAPLVAISYETSLFNDLVLLCQREGHEIARIEPEQFFLDLDPARCYINLVTLDIGTRKKISQCLDEMKLGRFSYINNNCDSVGTVSPGAMLCTHVSVASNSFLEKDVISMGHCSIGHNTRIGQGTVISPSVVVSGSVKIGSFCYLHTRATVLDHISIAHRVDVGAGSMIRKNITESGHYLVNSRGTLVKL